MPIPYTCYPIMPEPSHESSPVLFVLLGASNLARGHRALTHCLQKNLDPRRAQFLFALGPGRGYCAWGGFLRMVYSPIRNSLIFATAQKKVGYQVVSLITDIGNDIMYNVPPEDIIACLEKIFHRLRELNALIFITPIPSSLETQLSQSSFLRLRSIFYPKSKVSYEQAVAGIRQINTFLEHSVTQNIQLLPGLEIFSGWDKIHYSLLKGHLAWSEIAARILQGLNLNIETRVGCYEMLASYGYNISQLITEDVFSIRAKGAEYF